MKRTLLELTQDILSSIDGDQVNSISETVESFQVATIVKQSYYDIIDERDLRFVGELGSLDGLANTDKPNYLMLPETYTKIEWIRYDHRVANDQAKDYKDVHWLDPHEFVTRVNQRDSTDTTNNQVVIHSAGIPLIIDKTVAPLYWTSFDDREIVFDAYDSTLEATLQQSKNMVYAYRSRTFVMSDTVVPDLPDPLFQYLFHRAKSLAFAELKQTVNSKSEQLESRARVRSQRNDRLTDRREVEGVDYGKRTAVRRTFRRRGP